MAVMVVRMALINNENTIPKRMMVLFDMFLSILEEKAISEYMVIRPDKNPAAGRVNLPRRGNDIPPRITIPEPRETPDETPRVYGEASWFLRMDWITTPLMDREPPAIKARRIRGTRKSQTIDTFFGSIPA
jgi:hypothetical protein